MGPVRLEKETNVALVLRNHLARCLHCWIIQRRITLCAVLFAWSENLDDAVYAVETVIAFTRDTNV